MREFLLLVNDNGLVAAASVCGILALLLLLFVATQRGRYYAPRPGPRDDFAKMLILFQTMRDLLDQQKELARELNEAIDSKVQFVKERVDAAQIDLANMRSEVEELYRTVRNQTRADRDRREPPQDSGHPFDARAGNEDSADDADLGAKLRLLALPDRDFEEGNRLDSWVGLDLGDESGFTEGVDVPDEPLEEPADIDSAREAFKSLLNQDAPAAKEPAASAPAEPPKPSTNPNGEGRITPAIKGRVFEYSEAGMTISQIAKELGIGKGEVRLILSLRDIQGT